MKFPIPQLTSEQLEQLFKKSSFVSRYLHPPEVPEKPVVAFKQKNKLENKNKKGSAK